MSLEQAAKHLAAHGRGPDTELVHMTKGEINSLQTLAKANGGSLTVNPYTGLPEAGFLSSILPTVIGGAAMYFSGGAINPATAGGLFGLSMPATIGLGMGAFQTMRTGSLQKGLMAGLGAYGGAGLASGLMGAGAAGAQTAANQAIAAGPEFASFNATSALPGAFGEAAGSAVPQFASEGARQAALTGAQNTLASPGASMLAGAEGLGNQAGRNAFMQQMGGNKELMKTGLAAAAPMLMDTTTKQPEIKSDNTMPQRLQYNAGAAPTTPMPDVPGYDNLGQDFGKQRDYFPTAGYQNITPERAKELRGYAGGGPVEAMSNANAIGANTGYPMADINKATYATPYQTPISQNVVQGAADTGVNSMTGEQNEFARGGLSSAASHLGDYSDGGRLLKGPGDGVSDSIPATIGNKRPARLADNEFVIPARIVSEIGNGSTDAGARKLYAMLDRVQAARKKSIGKGKVAVDSKAYKALDKM